LEAGKAKEKPRWIEGGLDGCRRFGQMCISFDPPHQFDPISIEGRLKV
jgi:hypothetical protein